MKLASITDHLHCILLQWAVVFRCIVAYLNNHKEKISIKRKQGISRQKLELSCKIETSRNY